jgi:hypothetical protein
MNSFKEIRSEQLVQKCGEFYGYRTEYVYHERAESPTVSAPPFGMNREGEPIQLYPAQQRVLERLCAPLRLSSADVRLVHPNSLVNIEGHVSTSGNFPVTKILNLPPGYGKTLLTTLMCLSLPSCADVRAKMRADFDTYVGARDLHLFRSMHHHSPFRTELLANAVLIQAPLHLIGPWQNVVAHNARMFASMYPDRRVHVSPSNPDDLHATAFDPDYIRARPDELFVFVVHNDNMKDYLSHQDVFYSFAVFVSDEAADSRSAPISPEHNLVGMYNVLVTATPAHLADRIGSSVSSFLTETFRHPKLSPEQVSRCISSPGVPFKDTWLRSPATRAYMGNMICDVLAMNVVPDSLYDELTAEITALVPSMHEYSVRCADSYARRMGLVMHDMTSVRDSSLMLERVLNLQLSGKSVADVVSSIERQLSDIVRALESKPLNPRELQSRRAGLEKFRGLLQGDLDKTCGICLETSGPDHKFLTTCCAFICCEPCLTSLVGARAPNARVTCPKCRFGDALFSQVGARKKMRTSEVESSTRTVKDWRAFEEFVGSFNFEQHSQTSAVDHVLQRASAFCLSKVIIAGPNIETWAQFDGARTIAGFEIVRPKVTTSARKMDELFHAFCKDQESKQVLLLDSVLNASCELTGVDAKLTDLIIQVGAHINAAKQLSGRALRIGRNPLQNPVKIVLV